MDLTWILFHTYELKTKEEGFPGGPMVSTQLFHCWGPRFHPWLVLSLLWILFQVVGLFPLCLFGVVGFYLGPSFAQYFSVFSCYLTYCVWHILSFLVLPSVGAVGPVVCVGFMLGGTCACLLVGEGEFFPPLLSRSVLVVCLGVSVGSLSPLDILLVVWVRCPLLVLPAVEWCWVLDTGRGLHGSSH